MEDTRLGIDSMQVARKKKWLLESKLVEISVVLPYMKYTNFVDQK